MPSRTSHEPRLCFASNPGKQSQTSQTSQTAERSPDGPAESAAAVNAAARELASLVLLRGIDSAQEVYAREARMLAQLQAELRWQTANNDAPHPTQPLEQRQSELADWTEQLIGNLQRGMRYDRRPLAVLRLIRSVKDLRESDTVERMRSVRTLIHERRTKEAVATQAALVRTLLDSEFSVRFSGAYSTLIETRDLIGSLAAVQKKLIADHESLSGSEFESERDNIIGVQQALRKQLLTLMLPTVPAPRASLFDEVSPKPLPVDVLLEAADDAVAQSLALLGRGDQEAAIAQQTKAEKSLDQLLAVVDRWSIQLGLQSQGLSTLVAATSQRMARLEEFEARVIGLLDKTDLAAIDEKSVSALAESQAALASDVGAFATSLKKQDQIEPDPDLPPLLTRLAATEQLLSQAVESLRTNDAEQAIEQQEGAADVLAEAHAVVGAQNERLTLLQGMVMFQRSVDFANGYMADIVAEQRDLLGATEAAKPAEMKGLLPHFSHLRACMNDVAPLLDLVAARLDVGTPLAFAKTDFEDAMIAVGDEDQFEAVDAQDVAAESLGEVQLLVQDIRTQAGYLTEIVEFLHESASDAALLSYRQSELQKELVAVEQQDLLRFVEAQQTLLRQAKSQGQRLLAAVGSPSLIPPAVSLTGPADAAGADPEPVLSEPTEQMQQALTALQADDAVTAADQMELASLRYAENAVALVTVIKMLHGLPQVEINSTTEPALVRLVEVLAVASDHKQLFRETPGADDAALEALGERQREIAARLSEINSDDPDLLLTAAAQRLAEALESFAPSNRDKLRTSQRDADDQLRHFIVEQALILETDIPPAASSDAPAADGPGSDSESDVTAGFIADFVSGEGPQDKQSEWKVLAERNRAALNQNFARELPLEYRGLLKNYYERVAK